MNYRTNKPIYSRPVVYKGKDSRDNYMRAFTLTNELSRLEYEKKRAVIKISTLERRIDEIREEIYTINSTLKDSQGTIEYETSPHVPKKRHVTMEY